MHPDGSVLSALCMKIMAQSCAPWLNAVHPQLIDVHQASIAFITQCCALAINVAVHHYGSMLCIHSSHEASLWHNIIWLNAVQASIYGPMLCIRHHNMTQTMYQYVSIWLCINMTVSPCINMTRCIASSYGSYINTTRLITLNVPHHTLSTCFLLLCLRLTLEERRKKKNKLSLWLIAALLPWRYWRAMLAVSLARAALEKDGKALQSA